VKRDFNASLNGYRGFCALLVFGFHLAARGGDAAARQPRRDGVAELWISLAYGVEMFFMISGFVILGACCATLRCAGFFRTASCASIPPGYGADRGHGRVRRASHEDVREATIPEGLGIFFGNVFLLPPCCPCRWSIRVRGVSPTSGCFIFWRCSVSG